MSKVNRDLGIDKVVTHYAGRGRYFHELNVNDCVVRSISLHTKTDYYDVWEKVEELVGSNPDEGILEDDVDYIMEEGFNLRYSSLKDNPQNAIYISLGDESGDGHAVCKKGNSFYDTHDSRNFKYSHCYI